MLGQVNAVDIAVRVVVRIGKRHQGLAAIGIDHQGGDIHGLEIGALQIAQLTQFVIVPPFVRYAADKPGRAVSPRLAEARSSGTRLRFEPAGGA